MARISYVIPDSVSDPQIRRWLDQFWDEALEAFKAEAGRKS